ncbi:HSP20-like chaperone [Coprinellus micaceus]|uniref:HSP20-like chaperone n=1 Tax=Coprinellus micaceus TaxID=71717 RepID=A0A4Y7SYM2_COPMI|nr:HSP20-like chaperone [Coprinellus micaceus]
MSNIALRQAVERLANWKCAQAIKAGKLRVVQQETNPSIPMRFTPRMDLVDDPTTNTLIAIFELPGIKTGDITLQIRDGNLIIMGERRPPPAVQQALATRQSSNLPRNPISAADSLARGEMDAESDDTAGTARSISVTIHELRFGQFYRAIPIPTGLKESDVTAALQDGMLTVTWPKYPNGRPHGQQLTPPVTPSAVAGPAVQ